MLRAWHDGWRSYGVPERERHQSTSLRASLSPLRLAQYIGALLYLCSHIPVVHSLNFSFMYECGMRTTRPPLFATAQGRLHTTPRSVALFRHVVLQVY